MNEEGLFITSYYANCKGKVIQLNHRFYYYVQNQGSATHHVTKSQVEKIIENYHTLISICASLSASCCEKVKLRYVEVLIRFLGNHNMQKQLDGSMKRNLRLEIKHYLTAYFTSNLVSKRRKCYTLAVLWFPTISSHIQKPLKRLLHKSGRSW